HVTFPFGRDQQVSEIAIDVIDQVIEDSDLENLLFPRRGIRGIELSLQPVALHYAVINPELQRSLMSVISPLDGYRDHVESQQLVELVGGDLEHPGILEIDFGAGGELGRSGLPLVNALEDREVLYAAIVERKLQGVCNADTGPFRLDDPGIL